MVFRDPTQMLDWLHARQGSPEEKNFVLFRLLESASRADKAGDLAAELMLLALWPGLSMIRYRLRPLCRTGQLDADLVAGLSTGILTARSDRITRVAATLLRNLERDLRREYICDDRTTQNAVDLDAVEYKLAQSSADRPEAIMAAAQAALGDDGVLLAAVYICGFSQKEAARLIGISHEAARKRCQRALSSLKQNVLSDLSQTGPAPGFSLSSAPLRSAVKGADQ